ncbi:hypothetical protein MP11Mi_12360 [Gordonia sp. MP11Mi]|uniref:Uncharacterized protein n=1 Tax=Gordonia sp. MP11Mi TaxID=3022769 RepID=A0AA97CUN9_9ACTN
MGSDAARGLAIALRVLMLLTTVLMLCIVVFIGR